MAIVGKTKGTKSDACSDMFADDVFRKLLENRKILLNGGIDERIIEKAVMQIELFNMEDDAREESEKGFDRLMHPIWIFLHTPGGYCNEGLALVSAIEQSHTPVYTIAVGRADSMGFLILACSHYRAAYRHAELMYHQISHGAIGDHTDVVRSVEYSGSVQQKLEDLILERTKITKRKLQEVNSKRIDWYMTPEEALELGVIDQVIERGLQIRPPKKARKKDS